MTKAQATNLMIHKLDEKGNELWAYEAIKLEQNDTQITLDAFFDRDAVDIAGLQLRRGDRFVETFYFDRWYNIFAIYQKESNRFKGWYCNIARPAWLERNHLYAEDLALDLVVLPDRRMTVVDRVEFDALIIPAVDRTKALEALDDLIDSAQNMVDPFIAKHPVADSD
jgi:predicted RNA-binding protein associated with RNAse of E/G family